MGRRILALSDIPQLLTGMLKLDTGSCKTRVLSRLFPSGRMGDWGRLDTVVHLLLGSPPNKSCSPKDFICVGGGGATKSLQILTVAMKLKDAYSLEGKL